MTELEKRGCLSIILVLFIFQLFVIPVVGASQDLSKYIEEGIENREEVEDDFDYEGIEEHIMENYEDKEEYYINILDVLAEEELNNSYAKSFFSDLDECLKEENYCGEEIEDICSEEDCISEIEDIIEWYYEDMDELDETEETKEESKEFGEKDEKEDEVEEKENDEKEGKGEKEKKEDEVEEEIKEEFEDRGWEVPDEDIMEDFKRKVEASRVREKEKSLGEIISDFFSSIRNAITGKITGNTVYTNSEDIPNSPSLPGEPGEISHPSLSEDNFKVFNLLTGNAIIGVPDWSFDGTNTEEGNFVWESDFTEKQEGLQHFELEMDINFSKEDEKGENPVNGIINKKGYYLNEHEEEWVDFNWSGTEVWSSGEDGNEFTGWLRAGMNGQPTPSADLTLENYTDEDYAIFLAYSCMKFREKEWECNDGKWVVFVVETGDVDYHSAVNETPRMDFEEVEDLNISDIRSILEQFNTTLKDFQPPVYDIFNKEKNSEIKTEKGQVEDLEFYVKNFGNENITGIDFEIDIGEKDLVEVVNAELPDSLKEGEMKEGSISLLFKEEHYQTVTLWSSIDNAEVDTSDNMAKFDVVVEKDPEEYEIPERESYWDVIDKEEKVIEWEDMESYERRDYEDSTLEVISGEDKMRTVFGGYWNDTAINPTMDFIIKGMMNEEALFATPFLSSITMGGKMLTGDREVTEYKVRLTNTETGVYYETPEMEDSFLYHYNPKDLIPDFEYCVDYEVEVIPTGDNEETIDIIYEDYFNVCPRKELLYENKFKTERLLKEDGNYVAVNPMVNGDLFEDLDVRYFMEFEDPDSDRVYRGPVLNLEDGLEIVPVEEIFGDRDIDYDDGETFKGRAVFMDSLTFEDLEKQSFGDKYRVVGRDCREEYEGEDLYGFAGSLGFDNWRDFSSNKKDSEEFLCYDDTYYHCGSSNFEFSTQASSGDTVGSWKCSSKGWERDDEDYVNVSLDLEQDYIEEEEVTFERTFVECESDNTNGSKLDVYVKSGSPHLPRQFELIANETSMDKIHNESIEEIANNSVYEEIGKHYFVCSGDLDIYNETLTRKRNIYSEGEDFKGRMNFTWNDWEVGVNILFNTDVNLEMLDKIAFFSLDEDYFTSELGVNSEEESFLSVLDRGIRAKSPGYYDHSFWKDILRDSRFRISFYDLEEEEVVEEYKINGKRWIRWSRIDDFEYHENLTNGHFYELRVNVIGKHADLFKPFKKKLFYIDGWNFLLNNKMLYSRFLGMQNYPTEVKSYVEDDIPYINIKYGSADIYYDKCEGAYKKFNISRRYIPLTGDCEYPHGGYIDFEGSKDPVFDRSYITIYPVESVGDIETRRSEFNCKIGKYEGFCKRGNYYNSMTYFDERTNLVYKISLLDNDGRFLKKYRDAVNESGGGNKYDAVIYDILTQIDNYPIEDFELDYNYDNPDYIEEKRSPVRNTNKPFLDYYFSNNKTVFKFVRGIGFGSKRAGRNEIVIYDDEMNIVDSIDIGEIGELTFTNRLPRKFGGLFNYLKTFFDNKSLEDGKYYITFKDSLSFDSFWMQRNFVNDFIWTDDYVSWFFEDSDWGKYLIYPEDVESAYWFKGAPFRKRNGKDIENREFDFSVEPEEWETGINTKEQIEEDLDYYFCRDCINESIENLSRSEKREFGDELRKRRSNVTNKMKPSIINKSGGISREYTLKVEKQDDIYDFFDSAPKNCENAYDNSSFRDMVCSSRIYSRRNPLGPYISPEDRPKLFRLKCSWANLDKLEVYTLEMDQFFYNRSEEQVNNLPTETIEEMRNEFFHPVMEEFVEELPATPILDTSYGTIEEAELRDNFCI